MPSHFFDVEDIGVAGGAAALLLEDGSNLLLEDGSSILLESGGGGDTDTLLLDIGRVAADTAQTHTDTVLLLVARLVTDTGLTQTDTLDTQGSASASDTAVTHTDTLLIVIDRFPADTGVTNTDSIEIVAGAAFELSDTGVTQTDSLLIERSSSLSDQGQTHTDSIAVIHLIVVAVSDTGQTHSDTLASLRASLAAASDTGVTHSDSIGLAYESVKSLTDTGASFSDLITIAFFSDVVVIYRAAPLTDTGVTHTDDLDTNKHVYIDDLGNQQWPHLSVVDTGTTITDSVRGGRYIALEDDGYTHFDKLRIFPQSINDTGTTHGDTIRAYRSWALFDTGATIIDGVGTRAPRSFSDSGYTHSDTAVRVIEPRTRLTADTVITLTDLVGISLPFIFDQGLVQTDYVGISLPFLSDIATSFTDTLAAFVINQISDTAVTHTDTVVIQKGVPANDLLANRIALSPSGGTVIGTNAQAGLEAGESGFFTRTVWYSIPAQAEYRVYYFRVNVVPPTTTGTAAGINFWSKTGASYPLLAFGAVGWHPSAFPGNPGNGVDNSDQPGNTGPFFQGSVNARYSGRYREVHVKAGTELLIQVGASGTLSGGPFEFEYYYEPAPANHNPANAEILIGDSGTVSGTTVGAYFDIALTGLATNIYSFAGGRGDVFYKFTPDNDGWHRFQLSFPDTESFIDDGSWVAIGVMSGSGPAYTLLASAYQYRFMPQNPIRNMQVELSAGVEYTIHVSGNTTQNSGSPAGMSNRQWEAWRTTFDLEWEHISIPPFNDNFIDAEEIEWDEMVTDFQSVAGATVELDEYEPAASVYRHSIWYKFVAPFDGGYFVELYPTNAGTVTRGWEIGQVSTGPQDFVSLGNGTHNSPFIDTDPMTQVTTRTFSLRENETYYIRHLNTNFDQSNNTYDTLSPFQISFVGAPASNDNFEDAELITGASGSVEGSTVGATSQEEDGEQPAYYWWYPDIMNTVWYRWVAPTDGTYYFSTNDPAKDADTIMAIYSGTTLDTLTRITADDDAAGFDDGQPGQSATGFTASSGVTYYIQIDGFGQGEFTLSWEEVDAPTNHLFANAIPLFGTSGSIEGSNIAVAPENEPGFPDIEALYFDTSPDDGIGRVVWYAFTPPTTDNYTFSLNHDVYDGWTAWFGVFEGTSLATLTPIRGTGDLTMFSSAWVGNNQERAVAIGEPTNTGDTTGNDMVMRSFNDLNAGQTYYIMVGGWIDRADIPDPDFPILATDTQQGPFVLSWASDGVVTGPPNDDYPAFFSYNNAGGVDPYHFILWDGHDAYGNDVYYPGAGARTFSNVSATTQVGEPAHGGVGPFNTVWFAYEHVYTARQVRVWVESDDLASMALAVYAESSFNVATLPSPLGTSVGATPEVIFNASEWADYVFVVGSTSALEEGEFTLHWEWLPVGTPPANDDFEDAEVLVGTAPTFTGTTAGATAEEDEPSNNQGPWNTVWYKWVPTSSGTTFIQLDTTNNTSFYFEVWQGTALDNLVWLMDGFDGDIINPTVVAGQTYYIRVQGYFGDDAAFTGSSLVQGPDVGDGDDYVDAPDVPDDPDGVGDPTVIDGDTEGSTFEPGEPYADEEGGGSRWHKITIGAQDELVHIEAIHNAEAGLTPTTFTQARLKYRQVRVYYGATIASAKECINEANEIDSYHSSSFSSRIPSYAYWKLKANSTYFIQVIRESDQAWGPYTLTIKRWREHDKWDQSNGFDELQLPADLNASRLNVVGSEGYATVRPFGASGSVPQSVWCRFQVRITSGERLERGSNGDESPGNRNLTFCRIVDIAGRTVVDVGITPRDTGRNPIYAGDLTTGHSIGQAGFDTSGWTTIELMFSNGDESYIQGKVPLPNQTHIVSGARWSWGYLFIDGICQGRFTANGNLLRDFHFGILHYPDVSIREDDLEDWGVEIRHAAITDRGRLDGGLGLPLQDTITAFASWEHNRREYRKNNSVNPEFRHLPSPEAGLYTPLTGPVDDTASPPQGDRPWNTLPLHNPNLSRVTTWGALNGALHGWQGCWVYFEQFPTGRADVMTLNDDEDSGQGYFYVNEKGELWCAPAWHQIVTPVYCVARLSLNTWYWIEARTDWSISWDVYTECWINNVFYGKMTSWNSGWNATRSLGLSDAYFGDTVAPSSPITQTAIYWLGPCAAGTHVGTQLPVGADEDTVPVGAVQGEWQSVIESSDTHRIPEAGLDDLIESFGPRDEPGGLSNEFIYNWERDCSPDIFDDSQWEQSNIFDPDYGGAISTLTTDEGFPARAFTLTNGVMFRSSYDWNIPREPGDSARYSMHYYEFLPLEPGVPLPIDSGFGVGDMIYAQARVRSDTHIGESLCILEQVIGDNLGYDTVFASNTATLTADSRWTASYSYARHLGIGGSGEDAWGRMEVDFSCQYVGSRFMMLLNPEVFPRYAASTNAGADWELLLKGEEFSANIIDNEWDDGDDGYSARVYLDNTASLIRPLETRGFLGQSLFFGPGTPGCSMSLRHTDFHLHYTVRQPAPVSPTRGQIKFANMYLVGGGYTGRPDLSGLVNGTAYAQLERSFTKNIEPFTFDLRTGAGVEYQHTCARRLMMAPDGGGWTREKLSAVNLNLGFWSSSSETNQAGKTYGPSPWGRSCNTGGGAWISAAAFEFMVEAEPGEPPPPCTVRVFSVELEVHEK